ncbi:hypothetical protein LLG38_02575 [bacterium]|nr:hypothetical protein [bacterium]
MRTLVTSCGTVEVEVPRLDRS